MDYRTPKSYYTTLSLISEPSVTTTISPSACRLISKPEKMDIHGRTFLQEHRHSQPDYIDQSYVTQNSVYGIISRIKSTLVRESVVSTSFNHILCLFAVNFCDCTCGITSSQSMAQLPAIYLVRVEILLFLKMPSCTSKVFWHVVTCK
jgi:hypothetical protein